MVKFIKILEQIRADTYRVDMKPINFLFNPLRIMRFYRFLFLISEIEKYRLILDNIDHIPDR